MKHLIWIGLACAVVLGARPCWAGGLTLSVVQDSSSPVNLDMLQAGKTVALDVVLSGLDTAGGQTIGTLGGTVVFSDSLLGTPTSITAGSIVPDQTGFVSAIGNGVADATYSLFFSNSGSPITTNGIFFTFDVVVQSSASGSGAFTFNLMLGGNVDAFDANGQQLAITAGPDVPFSVLGPAVPEPGTFLLSGIGLTAVLFCRQIGRDSRRGSSGARTCRSIRTFLRPA
jgi:PEP-CTERM motif